VVKVVLDTNILVSSLLSAGPPSVILDLVACGNIIPFYTNSILREYWEVLSRKKFGFSPAQVTGLINNVIRTGFSVEGKQLSKNNKINEDDRIFYDTAVEAKAYLVTGNKKHFPNESFIVTPAKFLTIIGHAE